MRFYPVTFVIMLLGGGIACDGGLTPPPEVKPGIAGTIRFSSASPWPPTDSLQGLWLFASLEYPMDSARIITGVLIEPRTIFLYPSLGESLPYQVDSVQFRFELTPGDYRYVGVIQQLRPELVVGNFRVVGMLEDPSVPGTPRTISVRSGTVITGLVVNVNFAAPPPQPFLSPP